MQEFLYSNELAGPACGSAWAWVGKDPLLLGASCLTSGNSAGGPIPALPLQHCNAGTGS